MSVSILTSEDLSGFVGSKELTLVDFWADWCGPCKVLAPVLDSMSDKYYEAIKIGKINVAKNQDVGVKYSITSIPCLIIFKDGREISRMVGFKGNDSLDEFILKNVNGQK